MAYDRPIDEQGVRNLGRDNITGPVIVNGEYDAQTASQLQKSTTAYWKPPSDPSVTQIAFDDEIAFNLPGRRRFNSATDFNGRGRLGDTGVPFLTSLNGLGHNGSEASRAEIARKIRILGLVKQGSGGGSGDVRSNIMYGGSTDPVNIGVHEIRAGDQVMAYLPSDRELSQVRGANLSETGRVTLWYAPYDRESYRLTTHSIYGALSEETRSDRMDVSGHGYKHGGNSIVDAQLKDTTDDFLSALQMSGLMVVKMMLSNGYLSVNRAKLGNTPTWGNGEEHEKSNLGILCKLGHLLGMKEATHVIGGNEDDEEHVDNRQAFVDLLFPGISGKRLFNPDNIDNGDVKVACNTVNALAGQAAGKFLFSAREFDTLVQNLVLGTAKNDASPGNRFTLILNNYMR